MTALENIKNSLIDRILATKNEKLLEAIDRMSERDIETGNFISESELNKRDSEWLS